MKNKNEFDYFIDVVNILSFIIGIQNLDMNNQQINELQEHLNKQDEQYKKIIKLLEEKTILMKGE